MLKMTKDQKSGSSDHTKYLAKIDPSLSVEDLYRKGFDFTISLLKPYHAGFLNNYSMLRYNEELKKMTKEQMAEIAANDFIAHLETNYRTLTDDEIAKTKSDFIKGFLDADKERG